MAQAAAAKARPESGDIAVIHLIVRQAPAGAGIGHMDVRLTAEASRGANQNFLFLFIELRKFHPTLDGNIWPLLATSGQPTGRGWPRDWQHRAADWQQNGR
jgi:hypothetical protein